MSASEAIIGLLFATAGALLASVLSIVPALHIYNVAGLLILGTAALGPLLPPEQLALFFLGLVTSYSILNTIPSIFLSAPDDSTVFVVLPGQKYLMQQRGYEAAVLTGIGSLGGIAVLVLLTPIASRLFPALRTILQPHIHWIIWTIIAYMLISEWPKGSDRQPAGLRRWWDGWRSLTAGLVTFFLSGLLGFLLMYRSILPVNSAYQNLLPAFVGLFAVPWILQNLLARVELPPQHISHSIDATPWLFLRGTFAGALGGLFAAFFPVVTGGIGGFIAGHATAQRDDRLFIISQGASKVVYYVGGFLFFFVPGLHLTRGGMAWMLSTVWNAYTPQTYYLAVAAVLLTGTLSFFMLLLLTRLTIKIISRVHYRFISAGTLIVLLVIVAGVPALGEVTGGGAALDALRAGLGGLLICAVATGIGLIPVLWGSRRMNCMGVLLLPIALNMVGAGATVAGWLGLVQ
ncbi:MAG: tripartite tricarboxylate transporter permease [Anaerolineae bacterium]|nr:tripartite tricarboxylate transporter permease [Anaerolineae bacterium]